MLRASPSPMPETRDSNGVDAVLTSTPTALTQSSTTVLFTEIVLILAHADRSGINFDQLGERVLKPPGDRDRAAQGHVEVRQLLRAKSRGGVDRGPSLRDDYLGQLELGVEPNELRTEPVGVTRGGAVPDRDQFHPMLLGKPRHCHPSITAIRAHLGGAQDERGMATIGASSSLPPIPAKVVSPSRQRPLRLGDG